ncbi:MAG: DUF1704 domain-containing protein [Ignavibacteriae bacterium]|nr:DUF1704 domain-containing protein [Ignavibacteriota bacterium]
MNDSKKNIKEEEIITERFIDTVCKQIAENKSVRKTLPLRGRLHIDRPLPFLVVYRRPVKRIDHGTDKLVKGEASYLIASASRKIKAGVSKLVQNIIVQIASEHKAFLILEVWTKKNNQLNSNNHAGILKPSITLKISKTHFPTETVEALQKGLSSIYLLRQKINVEVLYDNSQWPEKMHSLVPNNFGKANNCYLIGIEIDPIFQNAITGDIFPLVLRKLHQGLSKALKLGVFQFSHNQTTLRPTNYQSLGRRAMVKAVWEVDQKLAEISNAYDFLLLVTPINIDQSWNKFLSSKFEKSPIFYYRPIPINPSALKTKLYGIPIEQIEDPTLSNLFYEKQVELEKTLSMLRDRRTRNFFYGSMQLYGELTTELKSLALKILENTSAHRKEPIDNTYFDCNSFAQRAEEELNYYKQFFPELNSKVQIREDITGLMVSKGNLLLGKKIKIPKRRVDALLQHEIGTHIVTYVNGKSQPFQQLYAGLAGYDELQEGIAVLTEYLVGGLTSARLRLLAGRVIAASNLIDGATFIDTFRELKGKFDFAQRIAYIITARIYRGGGLTKDAVYLRGLMNILKYFSSGGELEPLLVGKISSSHVSIIKELQARKVLNPPMLRPRYLENKVALEKLSELKNGLTVLDLIKRS